MRELLLGDEAVGQAAMDAGIRGAFSYPGTPATEIMEHIQARTGSSGAISARWSANEKVAYEEALGMSYVGRRSIVSMKHVGLNVAADAFVSSALTGAHGGLVLAVADDPGMHSSQNEQDTRFYADFARLPLFEPCSQQEAYDMTREAFELSERVGLPVIVRLVTRLAHSRGVVIRGEPVRAVEKDTKRPDWSAWTLLPVNARKRFRRLLALQTTLQEYSTHSTFNVLSLRGPRGVIASGIAYNYLREAAGDERELSLLKIGTYPLPVELIRRLVDHCREVLVVEEGYPLIEDKLLGLLGMAGKAMGGRRNGLLPLDGELTPERVRVALGRPVAVESESRLLGLPARPPMLCKGCPHCDTFRAVLDAVEPDACPMYFSDIGCYTLGAFDPYNAVHTCVDMGASISMGLGAAKAGAHPVICTIGDSTFTHSGMPSLLEAAYLDANMTVVILDNAGIAMTGGQEVFVTGEGFRRLLRGLGVPEERIVLLDPVPKSHAQNVEAVRREINHRGLSVIVASRPCIHLKPKRELPVHVGHGVARTN